jgi:hypothetical protein
MRGHPDVDLFESHLEEFFELLKELLILVGVGDIDEDADEVIAEKLARMLPQATNDLRFGGDGAEACSKFQECFANRFVFDGLIIVRPLRQ